MKKFLIVLLSVVLCVTLAVSLSACDDDTHNADGSPKNMVESIINLDDTETQSNSIYRWADEGNKASGGMRVGNLRQTLGDGTDYNKYSGFSFVWKKGCKYKITKIEFDITSQTPSSITLDCNFTEPKIGGGKGEYKHLDEVTIESGATVHIVIDSLSCTYSKFAQTVWFKNDGRTTDISVLDWQIKISNLFITAEKA